MIKKKNRIFDIINFNNIIFGFSFLAPVVMLSFFRNVRIKLFFVLAYLFIVAVVCIRNKRFNLICKNNENDSVSQKEQGSCCVKNFFFALFGSDFFRNKKAWFLSLFLDGIILFDFYENIRKSIPAVLNKIPLISPEITLLFVGIAGCVAGIYSLYVLSVYLLKILRPIAEILKKYKWHFVLLLSVNFVGIFALVRENIYFADDIERAGLRWSLAGDFSRYISDFLSNIFHGSFALADASPLPQIIAVLFISLAGVFVISQVADVIGCEEKISVFSVIAFVIFSMSPYFLCCLAYKYDAPYMALSVLASVLPFMYRKYGCLKYGVACFVSMIIVCTTYQASSGIFPVTTVVFALIMWLKKQQIKKIGKFILSSAVGYISGMFIFKFLLMIPQNNNYVNTDVKVGKLFVNAAEYFRLIVNDFPFFWVGLIGIIFVISIVYFVVMTKQNKLLAACISCVSVALAGILFSGVYLILEKPLVQPRSMYGFMYFVALLGAIVFVEKGRAIGKVSVVFLSWLLFVYAFVFGNMHSIQQSYINSRVEQIVYDLNNSENVRDNEVTEFYMYYSDDIFSPVLQGKFEDYPVLKRAFTEDNLIDVKLERFNSMNLKKISYDEYEKKYMNEDLSVIKDTVYHCIKGNDDFVYIELKK